MIETAFYYSGFKRTLCGSKWDTYKSSWSSTSTARYGCCSANTYMSSPEGTGTFVEADSCSVCPVGTHVSLATSVPNDELTCFVKMPDGCKGEGVRSCYPRKAVDDFFQDYRDTSGNIISKPNYAGTKAEVLETYGPMKDWDMSLVTNLNYLFQGKAVTADLSNWNVSRVTIMLRSKYRQFRYFSILVLNFLPHFIYYLTILLILFPIFSSWSLFPFCINIIE